MVIIQAILGIDEIQARWLNEQLLQWKLYVYTKIVPEMNIKTIPTITKNWNEVWSVLNGHCLKFGLRAIRHSEDILEYLRRMAPFREALVPACLLQDNG